MTEKQLSARIRELDSPGLQLTKALHGTIIGFTTGNIGTFLLLVVLGIVVEETGLASALGLGLDLDALFRASLIPVLIGWGAMTLIWPGILIARQFALLAAAREFMRQHPDDAPPRAMREELKTTPAERARSMGVVVMFIFGILLVLLIPMTMFMLSEDSDSFLISLVATAVDVALFGLGYAGYAYGRRAESDQKQEVAEILSRWGSSAVRADALEKNASAQHPLSTLPLPARRKHPVGAMLSTLLMIGFSVFMLGVLLRQPCRECEQVTWGASGEGLIDLLSGGGGLVLTLFGLGSAALWLLSIGRVALQHARVRRWAQASAPMRVDDRDRLIELLEEPSAMRLTAVTLAAFGTTVLTIAGGIAAVEWEGLDASIALVVGQALLFGSVLIGLLAARGEVRSRMLLRDALLPGDLPTPEAASRQRRLAQERKEKENKAGTRRDSGESER